MKYQQLTLEERVLISYLVRQGFNLSEIARQMGRHRSTISRELRRNRCHGIDSFYRYSRAHRRTITADNGTAFHRYPEIEAATNTQFYFANPHHSWERGTNENTNGLIRQYIPKGTSMKDLTQQQCDRIAKKLNQRPRKRRGFKTPEEFLYA